MPGVHESTDKGNGPSEGCPVHGRKAIDQVPAYDLNGIPEQAMEFCVACMADGATPGGTWSRLLPTEAGCKPCESGDHEACSARPGCCCLIEPNSRWFDKANGRWRSSAPESGRGRMMPKWFTVGFQWGCNTCDAGSHGGMDNSKPTIKASFEKAAKDHANDYGHVTQVDRMTAVRFTKEAKRGDS